MQETKIKKISKILQDEHGYSYIDLELEDGTQGYYPNEVDVLESFSKGTKVKYAGSKIFAGRNKISGLTKIKEMVTTKIKRAGQITAGNNNTFYVELETEDDITGFHFSDSYKALVSIKPGTTVQYSDIKDVKDKGTFFVGLNKLSIYTPDERRQLSIVRQSSIKAAIEMISIASPKGRWINPDGSINKEAAASEVIELSELLIHYASVE
jgi:hypothetical protein